jgi:sulfur relay (sulfurtransferase) DsrC/TusE family protein
MRRSDIPDDLKRLAFDFFYWFSRFEFALKEGRYLKSEKPGAKAEAGWEKFVAKFQEEYQLTPAAKALIKANPQRQIVGAHGLEFADVFVEHGAGDLARVVHLARTVRNNLFHGGKHGDNYWDDPDRMKHLLETTIAVLGDLAEMAGLQSDYERSY